MNSKETIQILAVLRAAYPNFYSKQGQDDIRAAVNLWAGQFANIDYETVNAAIQSLISSRTDTWPPNIGEVKAEVMKLTNPGQLTPVEAWNLVRKAISRSGYYAQEEWEKLPEICRELITPEAMHEMAVSDDFNPGVEGSNFQKSYQMKLKRKAELTMLPESVQMLLGQTAKMLEAK